MTNFEKLTASPEVLAAFLASIPAATSPWDEDFQQTICTHCPLVDCEPCPHEEKRSNPQWWLAQEAEPRLKTAKVFTMLEQAEKLDGYEIKQATRVNRAFIDCILPTMIELCGPFQMALQDESKLRIIVDYDPHEEKVNFSYYYPSHE